LALSVSYSPGFRHPILVSGDLDCLCQYYKILSSKLYSKRATQELVRALVYYNKRIDNGSQE
jgi:hypothetical protein